MYKETINNDEIRHLPLLEFDGKIHLVEDLEKQKSIAERLSREYSLGFDTESRPSFKKGVIHPVALLQLSTENDAFLFRLNGIGLCAELVEILSDPEISKIGVAISDDIKDLQKLYHFDPKGFVALEQFVKQAGIESNGLRKLAAIILDGRISKGAQVSNWAAPSLSQKQKVYAATDAWVSLKMFNQLREQGYEAEFH